MHPLYCEFGICYGLSVNLYDFVSGLYSHSLCRSALNCSLHREGIVHNCKLYPHSAEISLQWLIHCLYILCRYKGGVRVQLLYKSCKKFVCYGRKI